MSTSTWQDGVLTKVVRYLRRVFAAEIRHIDFAAEQKQCRIFIIAAGRDGLVVVVGNKVRIRWF